MQKSLLLSVFLKLAVGSFNNTTLIPPHLTHIHTPAFYPFSKLWEKNVAFQFFDLL